MIVPRDILYVGKLGVDMDRGLTELCLGHRCSDAFERVGVCTRGDASDPPLHPAKRPDYGGSHP